MEIQRRYVVLGKQGVGCRSQDAQRERGARNRGSKGRQRKRFEPSPKSPNFLEGSEVLEPLRGREARAKVSRFAAWTQRWKTGAQREKTSVRVEN